MKTSTRRGFVQQVQWLESGGGPFVILARHSATSWVGMKGDGDPTDFDRACSVSDYIGVIAFKGAEALVLGDAPFPTAWMPAPTFGGGYLLRMLWGDDLTAASHAVHRMSNSSWTTEQVCFNTSNGALTLFDAAHAGNVAPDRVSVELGPGRHAISTADFENEEMCLLVHRLVPEC